MSKQQQYMDELATEIIRLMQEHGTDWKKPWMDNSGYPSNAATKNNYQGINVINLMIAKYKNGFTTSKWATYKQWNSCGCPVKEGEKHKAKSVFYTRNVIEDQDGNERSYPFMKVVPVFNADQVENYVPEVDVTENKFNDYPFVERFVFNTQAKVIPNADSAAYDPAYDQIQMPAKNSFKSTDTATSEQHYYSTLLHELVHWTGHKDRCDRELVVVRNKDYAQEELVAEFGSAMLCSLLNLTATPMADHAQYLNYWVNLMTDNKKALRKAIADASKAVTFLDEQQPSSHLTVQLAAE